MKKINKTSFLLFGVLALLSMTGCMPSRSMRAQEIKADLALREMKSQIEDFKYQLNKYEVELQIVESKADSHTSSINQILQDISKLNQNDQTFVESTFSLYDKKIEKLENIERGLKEDLIRLKEHADEVLSSLSQFKQKIDTNETQLSSQQRYIEHLKTSLEAIMKYVESAKDDNGVYYIVQPGDSLDRIAKENASSIQEIKDLNQITSDLIVVGQKIRLKQMSKKANAIGIFDSGIGGLTVVKSLMETLPNETIYYLADTKNLPYGNKPPHLLEEICIHNINFLIDHPLKALVIACNTASAHAYESLKKRFNIPLFDVISPSVQKAIETTKNKKIGVLATESTVDSGVYEDLIINRLPDAEVFSVPCPLLVSVVEESMFSHQVTEILVRQYLSQLEGTDIDTLILGCTHYPYIKEVIQKQLDESVQIIDSGLCCVENLKNFLKTNKLLSTKKESSENFYFVTGSTDNFDLKSSAVLKQRITSQKKES